MDPVTLSRCDWATGHPLLTAYHDHEWGCPLHDEDQVFGMFSLDCFQAGLSWLTILRKREAFLLAFENFKIDRIAAYSEQKITELLNNPGIIRNRLKIPAVIHNAQRVQEIRREFGSFAVYCWGFSHGKTVHNRWEKQSDIPATSSVSDEMSRDMIRRGFKFAGSTICYAFMQSIGMVNDHLVSCFRYREVG